MSEQNRPSPTTGSAPRERLLLTAGQLFYTEGIRAIGMDRLLSEANVARATFYRHFASKDELAATYIQGQDLEIRTRFRSAQELTDEPTGLLRAVVIGISETVCGPGFRGCPFINAAVEYPADGSPIHQAVDAHRTWFHATLLDLFIAAGHPEPEKAARRLVLLRDGAMIGGYLGTPDESITSLRAGLDELLAPCEAEKNR
ncbi:TetR/AcrR family transcriptional regulator [Streptomyces sp. NPDC048639]|uniref:TetR/AcrR family transcriptional regulator n=1 Tax=Streptomyces sp. NPDC048639 TaxID=3365581 RepID=UPI0037152624